MVKTYTGQKKHKIVFIDLYWHTKKRKGEEVWKRGKLRFFLKPFLVIEMTTGNSVVVTKIFRFLRLLYDRDSPYVEGYFIY